MGIQGIYSKLRNSILLQFGVYQPLAQSHRWEFTTSLGFGCRHTLQSSKIPFLFLKTGGGIVEVHGKAATQYSPVVLGLNPKP